MIAVPDISFNRSSAGSTAKRLTKSESFKHREDVADDLGQRRVDMANARVTDVNLTIDGLKR